MEDDTEYKKLPVDERCVHKLWKARQDGYEECTTYFATITDEKSPEFQKFAGLMKKFVTDPNAVAQDKALDAVLVYVENAHIAGRTAGEVTAGIVTKCLAAPKKTTQEKALEVLLMYCEIEKQEAVQEELMKGFTQKNPKVVTGCVKAISLALKDFGNKVISIKLLIKTIGPLLEHRDLNVRDETKKMVVEMYRWAGPALNSQLTSLKPIQVQELEGEFAKLAKEKAVPNRLLRSQQELKAQRETQEEAEDEVEGGDEKAGADEVDPLDLFDAIQILDALPKDFFEKLEAKKWQERKESLEALLPLSQHAKIEAGDYADLVRALKKIIGKDTNVMLVSLAGQCITGLANGLKKKFSAYAVSCIETILGKFKEKKTNVLKAMRDAADAIFQSTNIEAIQEVAIASLNIKNPNVKSETASFLARSFCYCTPTLLNKKLLKLYTTELLKNLNDPDPVVRDSAADALGTALKVVGEKAMIPFISDVDAIKMTKIKEYCEKADIKVKITAPKPKPVPKAKEPTKVVKGRGGHAAGVKKPVAKRPVSAKVANNEEDDGNENIFDENFYNEETGNTQESKTDGPVRSSSTLGTTKGRGGSAAAGRGAPLKKGVRTASASRVGTTASKEAADNSSLLQVNTCKQQRMKEEQRMRILKWDFTAPRPDLILQLTDQMTAANVNEQLVINMFHKDFKFHIKSLECLQKDLAVNPDACLANLDLILRWLTIRFFDTNPSVLIKAMEYLKAVFTFLSTTGYRLLDYEANSFIPYLVMKFGDSKETIRAPAQNITTIICNIYPASKVSPFILEGLKSKNARQRSVCLESLCSMIEVFGMSVCQQPAVGPYLKEIAKQIADRDNSVRNAALNALVQVYYREGEKVYKLIGTLSAKDLSLLEERIKRSAKNRPMIKKPSEPENVSVSVRGGEATSAATAGAAAGSRIGRVVPTAAQPAPLVRRRMQIDYDFLEKLIDDDSEKKTETRSKFELEEIKDIDSLFSEEVRYPANLSRLTRPGFTSSSRYSSGMSNANNDDASQAISMVISQIAMSDITTVVTALSQIDTVILSDEQRVHLYPHIDQLLISITHQYSIVLNTRMADSPLNKEECIRIYRSLTACLISIFDNRELGTRAGRDSLHDTVHSILSILLDTRLTQLDDGPQVVKGLNVLVVRMIEKANFTHIFSALLVLLRESVGKGLNPQFSDLIMKCNWKAIRILPAKSKDLDVVQILEEIHNFMVAFPSNSWSGRPSNLPLRTMKTVMHNLVQVFGSSIFSHLAKVPHTQGSELQKYIMKGINAQKASAVEEDAITKDSNKLAAQTNRDAEQSKLPKKLSKTANATLSEIFKTIGSKENTHKGLSQLYEFKQKNPDADIDSYLRKSSTFFQNYIERGLKKVEMERRTEEKMSTSASSEGSLNSGPLSSIQVNDPANVNVNELVDQFKALASQAGFDNTYIACAVKNICDAGNIPSDDPSPDSKSLKSSEFSLDRAK